MATSTLTPSGALAHLPTGLRDPLIAAYNEIIRNFRENRWEPSELNGGKLCEVTHTILRGYVDGRYPATPSKPSNMVAACQLLEKADKRFARSVRIQIPRVLIALYEVRNNRGVGHVGGDVSPNHMDAVLVVSMAKWVVAELIRVFHNTDTPTATSIVEGLTEREIPIVWVVDGKQRVLHSELSMREKMLLLLYAAPKPLTESELVSWLEHSNGSVFRRDVLLPTHKTRLIEYDRKMRTVRISPLGARFVEANLPLTL